MEREGEVDSECQTCMLDEGEKLIERDTHPKTDRPRQD